MSLEARVESLQQEHDRLDEVIALEIQRPGSDDLYLSKLKREKLRLKDEIRILEDKLAHTA